MSLLGALGLAREDAPEAIEHLAAGAYQFLAAGGVVTLSEWAELAPEERGALGAAAKILRVEQARRLALAARDDKGRALVEAELDGGKAHDEQLLVEAVDRIAAVRRG